jgi:DNA-binding IclR family transcriptional regulator
MHELAVRINQSCHLVVRSGNQGLVILRQENPKRHANLSVRLGATLALASTCSGQMLLAHMEPADREILLRSLPRSKDLSRAKLEKALDAMRARGFEVQRSTITAGVTDISYPIRGFDGKVVAALTVPYLHVLDNSLPTTVEQTRRLLEEAARRIAVSLGWKR